MTQYFCYREECPGRIAKGYPTADYRFKPIHQKQKTKSVGLTFDRGKLVCSHCGYDMTRVTAMDYGR